jgi:hypothetical protein
MSARVYAMEQLVRAAQPARRPLTVAAARAVG